MTNLALLSDHFLPKVSCLQREEGLLPWPVETMLETSRSTLTLHGTGIPKKPYLVVAEKQQGKDGQSWQMYGKYSIRFHPVTGICQDHPETMDKTRQHPGTKAVFQWVQIPPLSQGFLHYPTRSPLYHASAMRPVHPARPSRARQSQGCCSPGI